MIDYEDIVNWRVISIVSSFLTIANSYSKIQILEKNYALGWTTNPKPLLLLFIYKVLMQNVGLWVLHLLQ